MVGETVEGGTRQQIIGEDFAPPFKGAVAGDDQGTLLIALGNDLIEILSRLGVMVWRPKSSRSNRSQDKIRASIRG
jgi:hypothetical protein